MGAAYEVAQHVEAAGDGAGRAGLDEHVAERGRLDRTGDDGHARRGRRCAWQSRAFWLPPPTTWTWPTVAAGERRRPWPALRRTPRPGSPRCCAPATASSTGAGHVVLGAPGGDPRRHVAGRHEARVLHVEDRHRAGRRRRPPRAARPRSVAAPRAQGLAEQPGAHHVGEEADGAVDAALVGEVGGAGRLGEHGVVELEADQAPGAEGEVGRVRPVERARRPRRRRCRASRPRRPGARARRRPRPPRAAGCRSRSPGSTRSANRPRAAARARAISSSSHSPVRDVEQPGRRGVGALGDRGRRSARRPAGRARRSSRSARARSAVGGELVEGVERQELQAGAGVELGRRRPGRAPASGPARAARSSR